MSVCLSVAGMSPFHVIFFEASLWPSGHMINSRPLIGQLSFTTKLRTLAAAVAMEAGGMKEKCLKAFWRRCYYPHQSRDALSPVCRIF